jgi:outer membrane protein insertion porin family
MYVNNRSARLAPMLAAALATTALSALPAAAQSVIVQGNSRVDAETIRSYFPQGRVDAAARERAQRDLAATGMFSDVRVSQSGANTVVRVVENSIVNRVTFVGNSRVKSDQLFAEIQTKSRGPYSRAMVNSDVQRILEIYRRVGRSDARVDASEATAPNGRVDVTFTVTEGSKTGIASINFVGNQAFGSWRLKNVMQTTESNLLSFLKTSDVYDPDRLAADMELIRRHYLKNGYVDFRIVSSEAQFDEARKGYVVTIVVDEGQQYRVGDVTVDSRIAGHDAAQARRGLRTGSGQVYNAEAVEKSIESMTIDAARRGHAFVQVRPRGDRDTANRVVNLGFTVDEGPRVYVERINIRGNTRTRDYVIRREFDLGEGDAYNRAMIDRAERRLKSLGYFKNVRITQEQGSSPDRVIVNVDVEDQPTGQFSIGAGYSTSDGVLGEVSIAEQNFLGRGQSVRLAGSNGQRSRGLEFSFTEPYFLDRRLSAGFDIFSKWQDNTQYSAYTSLQAGGTLRLGLPVTDEFSVGVRYSLYQTKIKVPNTTKNPFNDCVQPINGTTPGTPGAIGLSFANSCLTNGEASIAIKEAVGTTVTSLAGLTLSYNTLDNTQNPTQGFLIDVRPEVAGLGGDSRFFRITGDGRYFHPIADDVVGLLRLQGGHIQSFGGDKLRLTDHFNLGPQLVRGFAPGGIGPRDISYDPKNGSIGGTTYFGASAELQFPIFGIPKEIGLRGAVFADAGTLFNYAGYRRFQFLPNGKIVGNDSVACTATAAAPTFTQGNCLTVNDNSSLRSSVGAGLLWQSPIGPIRFDYSYALTKDKFDRTQAFRFSGGGRF